MTLIVLLILASVSISELFSEKRLFKRTEDAGNKYNEAKAREVLETVLLADGQYEKNTNPKYNQDDFLDELIKSEIPGSNVKVDVAIIGDYAYELDRSVPKIGRYLGKASELVFPTVTVTKPVLTDDFRSASFKITASEEKKGINKIEIWLLGEMIKEYTYTDGATTQRTETYIANRDGKYIIKAYADLMTSIAVEIKGIVPAVEFSPNGSTEWKKEHSTKITVKETGEKVKALKYKWTNSVNPPEVGDFSGAETCKNNDIIVGKDFTGIYYLWVLVEMDTNPVKTNICGSEGFRFDNEEPTVTLTSTPTSETSFMLTATASDNPSGITKYEFYIDGEKADTQTIIDEKATYTWNGTEMVENKNCFVRVFDVSGNYEESSCSSRTLLHTWNKYELQPKIEGKSEMIEFPNVNISSTTIESTFKHGVGCSGSAIYISSVYGGSISIPNGNVSVGLMKPLGVNSGYNWSYYKQYWDQSTYLRCANCGAGGYANQKGSDWLKGGVRIWYDTQKYVPEGPKGSILDVVTSTDKNSFDKGCDGKNWYEYLGLK